MISERYLAGLIDGDGCISLGMHKGRKGLSTAQARLTVTGICGELILALQGQYGGYVRTVAPSETHKRTAYWWFRGQGRDADIIASIEPFLVCKNRQARLALSLSEMQRTCKFPIHGEERNAEMAKREIIVNECKALNQSLGCPHSGDISPEYVAGFFDAEGTVNIYKRKNHGYQVRLTIANKCRCPLDMIAARHGGSICRNKKGVYHLVLASIKAHDLLLAIAPHAIVKRERINLAIEFRRLIPAKSIKLTPAIVDASIPVYERMLRLNRPLHYAQ